MPPKKKYTAQTTDPLAESIGRNLRKLRIREGHSLERLATASGVSRAMLSQIELGKSVPTISVLWKIAHALNVPFSAFNIDGKASSVHVIRVESAKILTSRDGKFTSRALFPHDQARHVEFYELELAPHAEERAVAHPTGTSENLVVLQGEVEIELGGESHRLKKGDAILFQADVPHVYRMSFAGRPSI